MDEHAEQFEATVYFVVAETRTLGNLLCPVHTKEDKELHASEALQIGRIQYGDLQIFIYSPVKLTTAESEQFNEYAIRTATGQLGVEYMPRYVEPDDED